MSYHESQDSGDRILEIAQKTLDVEPEEVPAFYLPLLREYLQISPDDTNFILEFADPKDPKVGGLGFGVITCMEDYCWQDINLDRDLNPDRPDGGEKDGFGSFFNYQMHCQNDSAHQKGRNARLARAGPSRPPIATSSGSQNHSQTTLRSTLGSLGHTFSSSSPPPVTPKLEHNFVSQDKKSSLVPNSSPTVHSSLATPGRTQTPVGGTSMHALKPSHSVNLPSDTKPYPSTLNKVDKKPSLSTKGSLFEPIEISSDSDDEVMVLPPSQIPEDLKKVTNKDAPFELSDDEDTIDLTSPQSSSPPKENRPLAPVFIRPSKASTSNPFARKTAIPESSSSSSLGRLLEIPDHNSEDDEPGPSLEHFRALLRGEDEETRNKSSKSGLKMEAGHSTGIDNPATHMTWYDQEYQRALGSLSGGTSLAFKINPLPWDRKKRVISAELEVVVAAMRKHTTTRRNANTNTLEHRITQLRNILLTSGAAPWVSPSFSALVLTPELRGVWQAHLGPCASSPVAAGYSPAGPSILEQIQSALSNSVNDLSAAMLRNNAAAGPSARPYSPYPSAYHPQGLPMPGGYGIPGLPGALGPSRLADDDHDWGYEMDRPNSAEGLTTLFQTALDDFQEDVKVEEALEGLGMEKLDSQMRGMNITLMPHQVIGVHWMVQQEKKPRLRGGILGDEMGLGKTVQAIATMVQNPSEDRKIRTTLIVLPLPLIQQWKAEIESKSDLTVLVYHGPNRTKSVNQLKNVDCVLTTYSILVTEGSDLVQSKKKKKKRQDDFVEDDEDDNDDPPPPKRKGPLYKLAWFRIILDEAANIRNKATKASRLVHELASEIRWCLTGTLIYNNLTDIFPLLHFVGVIDWEDFRNRVHSIAARKPRLAARRSQALLRRVMLRRTKESELNGKKILQLPPKEIEMVEMEFTDEERAIYDAVENAARVKVNSWYRAGTILKHYSVVLVLLTRLRQLCCHPYLLRASADAMSNMGAVTVEDDDEAELSNLIPETADDKSEIERATRTMGQEWVDKVKTKLEERYRLMLKDDEQAEDNDYSCAVCLEPYTQERITACHHSFCTQCIQDVLNAPIRDATGMTEDQVVRQARLCPLCRSEVTKDKLFRADAFFKPENVKAELEDVKPSKGLLDGWLKGDVYNGKKRKREEEEEADIKKVKVEKGKGKAKVENSDDEEDQLEDEEAELGLDDVKPSTKMKKIGDLLDMWREVDPTQKTLIFSSFVEMLELMAQFLRRKGIKYVMYTGKLRPVERDEAIKQFTNKTDGSPTVMLISLKCGGVGLNLTAANNVIGLDLAWSPASESQAIDRAHRIGQTRPVTVKRLVIHNTVEQRILALQEKKQALADGAMGEGGGGRLGRLSAHELVRLFGSEDAED